MKEKEELERKLKHYISQHCKELNFKIRDPKGNVTTIEWGDFPFNISKVNGIDDSYEFNGTAHIGISNDEGTIVKPMRFHGEALIKENGDIEINKPIIIENQY